MTAPGVMLLVLVRVVVAPMPRTAEKACLLTVLLLLVVLLVLLETVLASCDGGS